MKSYIACSHVVSGVPIARVSNTPERDIAFLYCLLCDDQTCAASFFASYDADRVMLVCRGFGHA